MKRIDVKTSTYVDSDVENNDKDPKFKVRDHVRISKYKNIFGKGYTSTWSQEGNATSDFAIDADLASLKLDVDGLNIDKVKNFYN